MFRNTFRFLALLSLIAVSLTATESKKGSVCLLPGDLNSAVAVVAVEELRADPALAGIEFHLLATPAQIEIYHETIATADVLLVKTHGRTLAKAVKPFVRQIRDRGGHAWAVGTTYDDDFDEIGFEFNEELRSYQAFGGRSNFVNMVRRALALSLLPELSYAPPVEVPKMGFYDLSSSSFHTDYPSFLEAYQTLNPNFEERPWVAILFSRSNATSEQTEPIKALAAALETRGYNALPVFGWPAHKAIEHCLFDSQGNSRVAAVAAFSLKHGTNPATVVPVLERLNVPVINAMALSSSRDEWESSPAGMTLVERFAQGTAAEFAGAIAPTVAATRERVPLSPTLSYPRVTPVPDRIERLADRVDQWVKLRDLPNAEKKVAVVYYNYPPGRENVGASYLNVLPESLWEILGRLTHEGYETDGAPTSSEKLFSDVRDFGSNARPGNADDIDRLVRSGAVLWPVAAYRKYFDTLPVSLRDAIIAKWGEPETSHTMVWQDPEGHPFFVFPVLRWGNVLFGAQPTRGWDQDIVATYHDLHLPMHHQYLAFYLWLQHEFGANAMIHCGTHGTLEWLPGREFGFTEADSCEVLVGAVPQLYPYIVDDLGEGLQAKRRGMAAVITHMTPPIDKASLNPELREISGLINDYHVSRDRGAVSADAILQDIIARAEKMGLLKDLLISLEPEQMLTDEQLEELEHYIKEVGEKLTPFGMHTFGVSPEEKMRVATADAMLSVESELTADEHTTRRDEIISAIVASGPAEMDALIAGLSGRYIAASPSGDPIRSPASLPTGRNFYGFDPGRLPTPASWLVGQELGRQTLEQYLEKHEGAYPDRLMFNLWATETNRHEGTMEAQILWLLGVKPKWDARGRVEGVELIPSEELNRPRIDITVTPSGLYRDVFPTLMLLLDQAVAAAKDSPEPDNPIRLHTDAVQADLEAKGVDPELAKRIALVRLFTEPSGTYGNGVGNVTFAADSWKDESQIADVYFNHMSHLFGQGFWGDRPTHHGADITTDVFRMAIKGTDAVLHSRSSNVFASLDNDDFFQCLGGAAMAVRQVDGKTPDVLVADLTNPHSAQTVSLSKFMGKELRSRYLNPKWIEAMLDEGYAGARFIKKVTDNLWGWQVTVPESVDSAKWQEFFEVYVQDRYELDIKEKFEDFGNLRAYQAMVDRMLVAVDKGYWKAPETVVNELRDASAQVAQQIAAEEASEKTELSKAPLPDTANLLDAAPATSLTAQSTPPAEVAAKQPPPTPSAQPKSAEPTPVKGKVIDEVSNQPDKSQPTPAAVPWTYLCLGAAALLLLFLGWWLQGHPVTEKDLRG